MAMTAPETSTPTKRIRATMSFSLSAGGLLTASTRVRIIDTPT